MTIDTTKLRELAQTDWAKANENAANECYDKDDISSLRSAAWQMTVCAEAIRARGK